MIKSILFVVVLVGVFLFISTKCRTDFDFSNPDNIWACNKETLKIVDKDTNILFKVIYGEYIHDHYKDSISIQINPNGNFYYFKLLPDHTSEIINSGIMNLSLKDGFIVVRLSLYGKNIPKDFIEGNIYYCKDKILVVDSGKEWYITCKCVL